MGFEEEEKKQTTTTNDVVSLNDVDLERLKQESLFLSTACTETNKKCDIGSNASYAHLNLAHCLKDKVIPIFIDEPSAIIAYTLSSLEYHCVLNGIPTERVRGCRHAGVPSVDDLETMIGDRQQKRFEKIKSELEI